MFEGHQKYIKIAPQAPSTSGHLSSPLLPYRWALKIQFGCIKGGSQRMGYVELGLSGANGKDSGNDGDEPVMHLNEWSVSIHTFRK